MIEQKNKIFPIYIYIYAFKKILNQNIQNIKKEIIIILFMERERKKIKYTLEISEKFQT